MNKKPISYLQTAPRWCTLPYRVSGELSTIGSAGCGPTCAAMVLSSLTGELSTPVDTCAWAMQHGYKALNQGTYYSYFAAQFKAYGIQCEQLLGSRIIHQPAHPVHEKVRTALQEGYYAIALMGPGTWTKGGHYVLVWAWEDKVHILDPASTRSDRLEGDPDTFRREVRNYWLIDAREHNEEDDTMMTQEQFEAMLGEYRQSLRDNDSAVYSEKARAWAVDTGLIQGGGQMEDGSPNYMWEDLLTREQLVTVLHRFAVLMGKA